MNLLVKLTELGQGGHRGRGSRDRQTQGGHVPRCVAPRQLIWGWPKAHGTPRGLGVSVLFVRPWRPFVRLWRQERQKGKERLPLYDFHRFLRLSWDSTGSLVRRSCYYVDLATNLIWLVVLVNSPVFLLTLPVNSLIAWDWIACNFITLYS